MFTKKTVLIRMFSLMEIHEAANLFPLDGENIGELADDIKKNGQQVPVEIYCGKLIDGRRRLRACEIAGVEPITKEVNPADPVAYVLSINLHRRHLTESQRAMIGAAVKEIYEKEAKERQKMAGQQYHKGSAKVVAHVPQPSGDEPEAEDRESQERESSGKKSRDAAGEAVGVSGRIIDQASIIMKRGVPELIAAVQGGRISVRLGEKIAKEEQDIQREIVAAENPGKALRLSREVAKGVKAGSEASKTNEEEESKPKKWTREPVGVLESQNAINCLCRIPDDDPKREIGLKTVATWIRRNLPRKNTNGKA